MSSYSEGQTHLLMDKLEAQGFTADHITKLGQCGRLADVRAFLEGRAEIVLKKIEATVVSILVFVKEIAVPAIAGKKTAACFTNKSRYAYRDSDLDKWLPKNQPAQPAGRFSVQRMKKSATFAQATRDFLGAPDTATVAELARILLETGAVTTLPAIESLIERQENGEDVGLRTDGWGNFFPVEEDENKKDSAVSVVCAHRRDVGQWGVSVYRLGYDDACHGGYRFFFRNTDTPSL